MATKIIPMPLLSITLSREFHIAGAGGFYWGSTANFIWPTANMIWYHPFVLSATYNVKGFWIAQNTQGAATVGRMGVYSTSGGAPLTKLVEGTSTIDLTTAGSNVLRKVACTATDLSPDTQYYLAVTVSTGGAWTGVKQSINGTAMSHGGTLRGYFQEAGAGTLPGTATPVTFAPATEVATIAGMTNTTTLPV